MRLRLADQHIDVADTLEDLLQVLRLGDLRSGFGQRSGYRRWVLRWAAASIGMMCPPESPDDAQRSVRS